MKYRVLCIIDSLDIGGTERQTVLNLSAIDRSRFEVFLCYLHTPGSLAGEVSHLGIETFCLGVKGKSSWPSGIYRLIKFIRARQVDLVHTSLSDSDVVGGIAARLAGVPVISTLTNPADAVSHFLNELHISSCKLGLARFVRKIILRMCYRHFIAVSEQVARSYIDKYGEKSARITIIPRAISRGFMLPEPSSAITQIQNKLSLNGAYPILLSVGRLIPQKGQKYLLEAMPFILESLPKAKLIIAGEGTLRGELEKTTKELGLNEAVSFPGVLDNIKALHLASDIFVFPSLSEGMPGALLEAAALAKPCVAFDIEPVREISEDGKSMLLVPQNDSQALAQAIVRLGSHKQEAQALGQRCREVVAAKFLIDNTIKELEAVYTRVLAA
jgi:glycosyltransferase involved in cell wall biosynthesis